jgi:hypothetical protein
VFCFPPTVPERRRRTYEGKRNNLPSDPHDRLTKNIPDLTGAVNRLHVLSVNIWQKNGL